MQRVLIVAITKFVRYAKVEVSRHTECMMKNWHTFQD
jgi:hypothetical protein